MVSNYLISLFTLCMCFWSLGKTFTLTRIILATEFWDTKQRLLRSTSKDKEFNEHLGLGTQKFPFPQYLCTPSKELAYALQELSKGQWQRQSFKK